MSDDEQAIRELVATWHRATAAGDLQRILSLMAGDVIVLTPGRPPMRGKDAFAAGFRTLIQTHRIESTGTITPTSDGGDPRVDPSGFHRVVACRDAPLDPVGVGNCDVIRPARDRLPAGALGRRG